MKVLYIILGIAMILFLVWLCMAYVGCMKMASIIHEEHGPGGNLDFMLANARRNKDNLYYNHPQIMDKLQDCCGDDFTHPIYGGSHTENVIRHIKGHRDKEEEISDGKHDEHLINEASLAIKATTHN